MRGHGLRKNDAKMAHHWGKDSAPYCLHCGWGLGDCMNRILYGSCPQLRPTTGELFYTSSIWREATEKRLDLTQAKTLRLIRFRDDTPSLSQAAEDRIVQSVLAKARHDLEAAHNHGKRRLIGRHVLSRYVGLPASTKTAIARCYRVLAHHHQGAASAIITLLMCVTGVALWLVGSLMVLHLLHSSPGVLPVPPTGGIETPDWNTGTHMLSFLTDEFTAHIRSIGATPITR